MTEPQSKALKPIDEVRKNLTLMEGQFKMALPPQITPERFCRILVTAIQNNDVLLDCSRASLYAAAMKSAQDGLLPDGRECALIPFGANVRYVPMVGGILKKIRNSGELKTITAEIVYEKDQFNYYIDSDGQHVEHKPNIFSDRGEPIGVYGLAQTKDGGVYFEPMTKNEIEAVRNMSKAKKDSPWDGPFYLEMWKKAVIKRLSKKLPMSTDIEALIHEDDDLYDLNKPTTAPQPPRTTSSRLSTLVGTEDAETVPATPAATVPEDKLPI